MNLRIIIIFICVIGLFQLVGNMIGLLNTNDVVADMIYQLLSVIIGFEYGKRYGDNGREYN